MTTEVTDWISAVSDAAAAVGTVGALWVGAITLRRQVNDQHRAQASAVTVSVQKTKQNGEILEFMVQNDSPLPIYEVMLIASDRGDDIHQDFVAAMPPRTRTSFQLRETSYMGCRAKFYDSSGKRWVRHFNGQLRDITPKRTSRLELLYIALKTHDPARKIKRGMN
ncbi:hypothetical protein ACFVVC_03780 [Pseudarthrobacter sp. NPDC058196]|uniref:hypothetical protein n=1 Tax=Pseudarthrobacter sp. NPDC058196 TaxID=3346376 RepID=UPI0036D836DD